MSLGSEHEGKPLLLVGFMATGKTTVGQIVAGRLGRQFLDLDQMITEAAGMTIGEIFRSIGEPGFRALESEALMRALALSGTVIATGGGAACQESNLKAMLARGTVVALSASPAEVLKRVGSSSGRPLLEGKDDQLGSAAKLLREREPFYSRAHLRIETVGKSPDDVATEIIEAVKGS